MSVEQREPRQRLRWLLSLAADGELSIKEFCEQFERTYNLELDKRALPATEAKVFGDLFEQVVWYSPFPEERADVPNYRSEEQIKAAVEAAVSTLRRAES